MPNGSKSSSWKTSFLQELEEISAQKKIKDYRSFLFWYIKETDTENSPDDEILETITDRGRDAGCDAIIIDHNGRIIKIIQSKFTSAIGESAFDKDELIKLNKIYDYLTGKSDYYDLREYISKKLREKLDRAIQVIKESGYGVKLYFITTHKENLNYHIYDNAEEPIEIICDKEIERKYEGWRHGRVPELGEIKISYENIMDGPPTEPKAFIVSLKTEQMQKLYMNWKDKLFSRNVRIFYEDTKKPNKDMASTLEHNPDKFWYFNNGITILSEHVEPIIEQKKLILRNPQIINGCQTVGTIGNSKPKDNSFLFAKIVEISDNVINQNLIDGIIEANNRQTPVDERILKSNHPLQVRLQRQLEPHGFYFERKEGQYKDLSSKLRRIGNLKLVKNIDIIKTNIAIVKSPHNSHANEDDLFSTHFKEVFVENKGPIDYMIPWLVWKRIDSVGKNYRGINRKRFHKLAEYHVLRIIFDHCSDLTNNMKLNDILKKVSRNPELLDEHPIKELFDIAYKKFGKSKFVGKDSGQRDFFRNKDTYKIISDAVSNRLRNSLKYFFLDD